MPPPWPPLLSPLFAAFLALLLALLAGSGGWAARVRRPDADFQELRQLLAEAQLRAAQAEAAKAEAEERLRRCLAKCQGEEASLKRAAPDQQLHHDWSSADTQVAALQVSGDVAGLGVAGQGLLDPQVSGNEEVVPENGPEQSDPGNPGHQHFRFAGLEVGQVATARSTEGNRSSLLVRYVKVVQKTDCLQISFLEVIDVNGQNVALGKTATSSSRWELPAGNPMNAVTGVPGPRSYPSIFHGECEPSPQWWMVDLGANVQVTRVVYYNRAECCSQRAASAVVQLLDAKKLVLTERSLNKDLVQTLDFSTTAAGTTQSPTAAGTTPLPQDDLVRYVRILQRSECLQVSFLEVFGRGPGNLALNKLATSSGGWVKDKSAGNPVTAVTDLPGARPFPYGFYSACTLSPEWWMVDLGTSSEVTSVVYYNRKDCCSERATGAVIQLLDASENVLAAKPLTADLVQKLDFSTYTATTTAAVPQVMTCCFVLSAGLTSVFYNGVDVTSSVQGLGISHAVRTIAFRLVPGAQLVIAASSTWISEASGDNCKTAGFAVQCSGGLDANSPWETNGATTPFPQSDPRLRGAGTGWSRAGPCASSNTFSVVGNRKIWSSKNAPYSVFRVQPLPKVMTCQFSIDNTVKRVFYNDVDITSSVDGYMQSWNAVRKITFNLVPNAYLVIAGESTDCAKGDCDKTCFSIKCRGDLDVTEWESIGSATPLSQLGLRVRGAGSGWTRPGSCGGASGVPRLGTQIWGAGWRVPYSVFRVQPQVEVMTCRFAVGDEVTSVFYDDVDITSSVEGALAGKGVTRKVKFNLVPNAYLTIAGRASSRGGALCASAGFVITCNKGLDTSSRWETVGSVEPFQPNDPLRKGAGAGWRLPGSCRSRSNTPSLGSTQIWGGSDSTHAAFRTQPVSDGTDLSRTEVVVMTLLSDPDPENRAAAMEALVSEVREQPDVMADSLFGRLQGFLADTSATVRAQTAQTISRILTTSAGNSSMGTARREGLVRSFMLAVRDALHAEQDAAAQEALALAARAFGRAAEPVRPALQKILGQMRGPAEPVRAAILALQDSGDDSAHTRAVLAGVIRRFPDADVRALACSALWSMQEAAESEVGTLGAALYVAAEPSPEVRAAAARALSVAGYGAVRVLDAVVQALADPAWQVRLEAARIVLRFGQELEAQSAQRAGVLLKRTMMDEVPSGSPPAVRTAATQAIGALGRHADAVLKDLESALLTSGLLDVRKAAEEALQQLSTRSPAAMALWKDLEEALRKALFHFSSTAQGSANPAEVRALARRSFETGLFFVGDDCSACWPVAGHSLLQNHMSSQAFAVALPKVDGVSDTALCAALCARATPFVIEQAAHSVEAMAAFQALFQDPGHNDWKDALRVDTRRMAGHCAAFTVLKSSKCLLFQTMPNNRSISRSSGSRIMAFYVPSSVAFCAKAWENRAAPDETLLSECKRKLSNDVAALPAPAAKLSTQTVGSICEEECAGLVQRVKDIASMPGYLPERRDFDLATLLHPSSSTDGTEQVAFADACTRDVVQLVEHRHIKCCAAACGWNPQRRECEGAHLLEAPDLARWERECCSALGVIRGSDRDLMCRSALRRNLPTDLNSGELTERGESEAAEMGQEVSASLNRSVAEGVSEVAPGNGLFPTLGGLLQLRDGLAQMPTKPPLSEVGYQQVLSQGSDNSDAVADFITRVAHSLGAAITDVAGLHAFVPLYNGQRAVQSYARLVEDLTAVSQQEDGWVRREAAASPCRLDCSEPAFLASVLLQCSDRLRQQWFATFSPEVCGPEVRRVVTRSPQKCAEEAQQLGRAPANGTAGNGIAGNVTAVQAASWQLDRQSLAGGGLGGGQPSGLCRLFASCRPLALMLSRAKAKMNASTEVLWARVTPPLSRNR